MNRHLETVVVCPFTTQLHAHWASRVKCQCDGVASEIAVDLIRTVSKSSLTRRLGRIEASTAQELRQVVALLCANDLGKLGITPRKSCKKIEGAIK